MSGKTVLVLGGGLGGITAAGHLRRLLAREHRVVMVDRRPAFSLCMANLWLMTGERKEPAEGERDLSALSARGIEFVRGDIESIDPAARTVRAAGQTLQGDYLIVSLGAEKRPEAVPGFAESALNLYEPEGAIEIHRALDQFEGGRIVVLVARTPFSCPSAPYEAAFLIDSVLRVRGVRECADIAVYTPEDQPMPVAGPAMGAALVEMLDQRGIEFHREQIAMRIDPGVRRILFELEDTTFDLLVGVPPHIVPQPVRDSGLADASGWVPVDAATLQTRHDGVFAIGDVTAVRLPNGMFLPKAGVFADVEARVVAENIAAADGTGPAPRFNGHGFCFIETGNGMAAYGAGNFYGMPSPRVTLEPPSARYRQEKADVERTALSLWD